MLKSHPHLSPNFSFSAWNKNAVWVTRFLHAFTTTKQTVSAVSGVIPGVRRLLWWLGMVVYQFIVCGLHPSQIKGDFEEFLWKKGRNHNKHLFPFLIPRLWPINSLLHHYAHSRPLIFHSYLHQITVCPCFLSVSSPAAAHVEHFPPLVTLWCYKTFCSW